MSRDSQSKNGCNWYTTCSCVKALLAATAICYLSKSYVFRRLPNYTMGLTGKCDPIQHPGFSRSCCSPSSPSLGTGMRYIVALNFLETEIYDWVSSVYQWYIRVRNKFIHTASCRCWTGEKKAPNSAAPHMVKAEGRISPPKSPPTGIDSEGGGEPAQHCVSL